MLVVISGCLLNNRKVPEALTIWHWMTDREDVFKELAKRYEAKTGIKINFELYAPSEAYSQKVRAAAQGANLPDIFAILGEKRDFASFVKAGFVLDLTAYMQEDSSRWEGLFYPKAIAVNSFSKDDSYGVKPGIYGVPIDIMTIQMLYNKSLFKILGLNPDNPPKDFTEILNIAEKIRAEGLQGLVSGFSEVWLIYCFAENYAFNIMGPEKILATIKGEVPYTDSDWIKVLELFKDMQESGLLAKGIVTMVNKTAEQLFANEKAVFAFNGSWSVNVYKAMNPKLNYAVFSPPRVSYNYPMVIRGGAGSSFVVNARSPKKEEAVNFLRWLTEDKQQVYLSEATNNLPANKKAVGCLSGVLAGFAKGIDSAIHPNLWGERESPSVIDAFGRGVQSIIIGKKAPKEVALEIQKIKEKELIRKHK
ncbi:MAG: extracellular solute-binding protein [Euryarchaeota archaeon]|nr:extracellular solute-binding protein [Euryarchaeota archaeon]